jgi:hypothetical protein
MVPWDPTLILNNNQSTLDVVHKLVFVYPKRLCHISIKHAFVNNHINQGDISIGYIPGNENLANLLTKHIPAPKLRSDKIKLGMHVCD